MGQVNHRYMIGQRVAAEVDRLLSYGILISLDDGTRGYIRRRELSWSGDVEPQSLVHEGQRIEAVVLELPRDARMLELSLRATLPAP
jgi:ribosomal protein S1